MMGINRLVFCLKSLYLSVILVHFGSLRAYPAPPSRQAAKPLRSKPHHGSADVSLGHHDLMPSLFYCLVLFPKCVDPMSHLNEFKVEVHLNRYSYHDEMATRQNSSRSKWGVGVEMGKSAAPQRRLEIFVYSPFM